MMQRLHLWCHHLTSWGTHFSRQTQFIVSKYILTDLLNGVIMLLSKIPCIAWNTYLPMNHKPGTDQLQEPITHNHSHNEILPFISTQTNVFKSRKPRDQRRNSLSGAQTSAKAQTSSYETSFKFTRSRFFVWICTHAWISLPFLCFIIRR